MSRAPLLLPLLLVSCAVFSPRYWEEVDFSPAVSIPGETKQKVLIASRDSEFKRELVARVAGDLQPIGVGLELDGVGRLARVIPADFAAIVVVVNCRAWGLNRQVQGFLDARRGLDRVILVVSRAGGWQPDAERLGCDVITTASRPAELEPTADEIVTRVRARLDAPR